MKKIIALVLALVMVLSLGTVAFAAEAKQPVKYETIERVGEIAANAAARALQIPAFVLGTSMKFNQNAIVGAAKVAGAATYYGTKAAATTLDNAVAIGGGIAQARITVTGGVVAGAINLLDKAVRSLEKESGTNSLLSSLDKDLVDARDTVRAGVEVADKAIDAVKNAVDNAVDVLFNDKLSVIVDKLNIKKDKEQDKDKEEKTVLKGVSNVAVGDLILKEILVPGAYYDKYGKAPESKVPVRRNWYSVLPADMTADTSYLSVLVKNLIDRAYDVLTDSTNFEEMNGALKYYNDGGEVAEFLYKTVYNLVSDSKWDGYVPSWEGKVPAQEAAQAELVEMR